MVNCDAHDGGCKGGFLDNAWTFLMRRGVQSEECTPYQHCPEPLLPNCSLGPTHIDDFLSSPPPPAFDEEASEPPSPWLPPSPSPPTPPRVFGNCSACASGERSLLYRAASAYMAAPMGDARGMQREMMKHGPIVVGFFVYSDFAQYKARCVKAELAPHPSPDPTLTLTPAFILTNTLPPAWLRHGA